MSERPLATIGLTLCLRAPLSPECEVQVYCTRRPTQAELDQLVAYVDMWKRCETTGAPASGKTEEGSDG